MNIKNYNIEDLQLEEQRLAAADELLSNDMIIVRGLSTIGVIKEHSEYPFDYTYYSLDAPWDENEECFSEDFELDGGVTELGDASDAINHFMDGFYQFE